jgi:hypothetical protein
MFQLPNQVHIYSFFFFGKVLVQALIGRMLQITIPTSYIQARSNSLWLAKIRTEYILYSSRTPTQTSPAQVIVLPHATPCAIS